MIVSPPPGSSPASRVTSSRAVLPLVAISLAVLVAVLISRAAISFGPAVVRLEIGAVFLLVVGIALRSERLVAVATIPAVVGLLFGVLDSDGVVWGTSLLAGCLWFLATESALASIEWGEGLLLTPGVVHRRAFEVATVVALAAAVGVVSLIGAALAPDRSVLVQLLLLAFVLVGLVLAARHMAATGSDDQEQDSH